MARLVECVPNFSEGRRAEVIEAILAEIKSVEGVMLLDKEMDKDHNRAVISFVGGPQKAKTAAFKAIARAAQLIDMDQHKGEYEGIKKKTETNPDRKPDYGPSKLPKAGATAIGARMPLIAFNVYLGTR